MPNLLTFISGRLVNEELLNDNEEEVKKLLDSDESYDFLDSPVLFKFILENNLVRYINRLGPGALDETYVVQYLDLLDENITAILPDVLFASDIYLKHCIDNGKSDLVSLFCCRCYDGLSDDYIAKLVSYLKTPFEGNISFSYKILEYFVKNGKLEYISEFDEVVLGYTDYFRFEILFESSMNNGRKLLSDNLSTVLYPYFVKNGLPENLKGNVFFLKLLLIRKGYKLIEQFNSCVFEELDPTKATNILEKHNYIETE